MREASKNQRRRQKAKQRAIRRQRKTAKRKPGRPINPRSQRQRKLRKVDLFKGQPTYAETLDQIFGDDRWRNVAITETTGTIVGGEVSILRQLERNRGWKFAMVWHTAKDERVCKICRPFNRKPRSFFARRIGFPPAHPRCRCYLTYRVLSRGPRKRPPRARVERHESSAFFAGDRDRADRNRGWDDRDRPRRRNLKTIA